MTGMDAAEPVKRRWFCPTPDRLVIGLLVVEFLLWLSNWLGWWHKGYAVLVSIVAVGVVLVVMLLLFVVALILRRRFQFGLRSLLVLAVVVAIPCSWMTLEMRKAREQWDTVQAIKKSAGGYGYDWFFSDPSFRKLPGSIILPNPQAPEPVRLRSCLGDDFFSEVVDVSLSTDALLSHIARLTQLHYLRLNGEEITDAGMIHLAGLTQLHFLWLDYTKITDAGLAHLSRLTQLQELSLRGTKVTDEGVKKLQAALPNCRIIR